MNLQNKVIFKSQFLPFFLATSAIYWVFLIIRRGFDIPGFTIAIGTIGIASFIALSIIFFTVTISKTGIRSYNGIGIYKTIPWAEIALIKESNIFGLKYIKLYPNKGTAIWVPVYIENKELFSELAIYFSPTHGKVISQYFGGNKDA